jgi:hypothetical protein
LNQARRLRDDLTTLLLVALLTVAAGCSAKVEVVNERSTPAETDSVPTAPPSVAVERQKVNVDVDIFFGRESESEDASTIRGKHRAPVRRQAGGSNAHDPGMTVVVVQPIHRHKHKHIHLHEGRHVSHTAKYSHEREKEAEEIRRIHRHKLREIMERSRRGQ